MTKSGEAEKVPKRGERAKERKFRRTTSGKVAVHYFKGKAGRIECAICGEALHGTPHGKRKSSLRKLAKSERAPSAVFGGVLCTKCRTRIWEDAAKVKLGIKNMDKTEISVRKYIETALRAME